VEDFVASAAGAEDAPVAFFLLVLDPVEVVAGVPAVVEELSVAAAVAFLDFFDFLVVVVEL
jgi:hypothetical protein